MTLAAMVSSMGTFILTICCYLVIISPIFQVIFQTETVLAVDLFTIIRHLVDNVFGTFFTIEGDYAVLWDIVTLTNVMLTNVFLLNYLVAILSTVYEQREEQGDFAFKQNKYMYIERYAIAM